MLVSININIQIQSSLSYEHKQKVSQQLMNIISVDIAQIYIAHSVQDNKTCR